MSVGYHSLALDSIYSWGGNDFGELGHFENKIQPYAKKIDSLSSITNIAGWHHSVARERKVFIWGSRINRQVS